MGVGRAYAVVSKDDALKKLQRYCAYQERCHQEVRQKLLDLGIYGDDLEDIIAELITDNFLNELRFAQIYAGGKFRIKKWGRHRIRQELKKRKYRKYDRAFKKDAVSQMNSGRSAKELAQLLGVSESLLYKWKNESTGGKNKEQSDEIKRLRRQLKEKEEENEILKKALSIFSRSD